VLYVAVAYALAWAVCLPLWLGPPGTGARFGKLLAVAMMWTPALAAWLALRAERSGPAAPSHPPGGLRRALAVTGAPPGLWRWVALAWVSVPVFCLAAPFVGAAFGLYQLDLQHFSGFRALLQASGRGGEVAAEGVGGLVATQLALIWVAPALNLPFALGEELGWRGYLLPRLLPLGQLPALALSGAVWGLWHAPLILKGHNYPNAPELGVLLMVGFCVVFGVLFGWLRLASGSVWPAVIAHGALNGAGGVSQLLFRAGAPPDPVVAGITGWTGWLLPLAAIALLLALGRLPVRAPAGAGGRF